VKIILIKSFFFINGKKLEDVIHYAMKLIKYNIFEVLFFIIFYNKLNVIVNIYEWIYIYKQKSSF